MRAWTGIPGSYMITGTAREFILLAGSIASQVYKSNSTELYLRVAVHHLAVHREAQEVALLVDLELGHHHRGSAVHGGVVHWWLMRHHCGCLHFQIL